MSNPLFGIVAAGQPAITDPVSSPSEASFLYTIPTNRSFSHVVVFLLPGIVLPPNTAAAIYFASPLVVAAAAATGQTPTFEFLGGIGPGKESAIFKINATGGEQPENTVIIGISIEDAASVATRIQDKTASNPSSGLAAPPTTTVLAQRIIQNAFNFLSGFSGTAGPGGVEVVPLKAFEEWWKKFESRIRSDPSFLEKQQE